MEGFAHFDSGYKMVVHEKLGQIFLMPNVEHLSTYISPLTPDCKTIKEHLIFFLLAIDDSSVICKLEPMDRIAWNANFQNPS